MHGVRFRILEDLRHKQNMGIRIVASSSATKFNRRSNAALALTVRWSFYPKSRLADAKLQIGL